MQQLSIVLLQIDIIFGDPEANRRKVSEWFAKANLQPNELVLLPELWDTGYDLTRLSQIADLNGQNAQTFLSDLAKNYHVFIAGGSIASQKVVGVFNTTYLINPQGQLLATYEKAHLFRLMSEEKFLQAGKELVQVPLGEFIAAPFICYDLRFPEWFRKSASQGTTLFLLSAQWPTSRIPQWKKLIQARAIENQAFVVAVNRVGQDPENQFGGHSMVVNPLGEPVLELSNQESIGRRVIDFQEIAEVRKEIPVFSDRRPELYQ